MKAVTLMVSGVRMRLCCGETCPEVVVWTKPLLAEVWRSVCLIQFLPGAGTRPMRLRPLLTSLLHRGTLCLRTRSPFVTEHAQTTHRRDADSHHDPRGVSALTDRGSHTEGDVQGCSAQQKPTLMWTFWRAVHMYQLCEIPIPFHFWQFTLSKE